MQVKESISINRTDTSVSKSGQLDYAIPQSKIASLSSGEFVSMVADDPHQKIKLKNFHCEIINDIERLKEEEKGYQKIPILRQVSQQKIMDNYYQIKRDVRRIIDTQIERLKRERRESNIDRRPKRHPKPNLCVMCRKESQSLLPFHPPGLIPCIEYYFSPAISQLRILLYIIGFNERYDRCGLQ